MARLMQPVMQRYPETPPTQPSPPTGRVAPKETLAPDVELPSHSRLPRLDLGVDWARLGTTFAAAARFCGPRGAENLRAADRLRPVEWDRRKNSRPRIHSFRSGTWQPSRCLPADPAFSRERSAESRASPHRAYLDGSPCKICRPSRLDNEPKPSPRGLPAETASAKGRRIRSAANHSFRSRPTQTLIQPDAPPTPPKIENPLPNIVEGPRPRRPRNRE